MGMGAVGRKRAMAVGALAAVAMMATTPLAGAHGGHTNQVHACVTPSSGQLRVIDSDEACKKGEVALDWSLNDTSGDLNTFKNELKSADMAVNEGGDPVSWFKLKDVPPGFADGTDAVDGGIAADLSCTNLAGCVSSTEIIGTIDASKLSGGITGTLIQDGAITARDLAGTYSDTDGDPELEESVVGAVTSAKIADGTIEGRDLATDSVDALKIGSGQVGNGELAAGAVTTAKQTANWMTATDALVSMTGTPGPPGGEAFFPTFGAALTVPAGSNHAVLITANASVTCAAPCSAGSQITSQVGEMVGGTFVPLSPEYGEKLLADDVTESISISVLQTATPGPHNYVLRVTQTDGGTVSQVVLNAVDLGST